MMKSKTAFWASFLFCESANANFIVAPVSMSERKERIAGKAKREKDGEERKELGWLG